MTDMQKMLAGMVRPLTDDEFKAACLRHSGMNDLESIRRMGFDHKVAMVSRLLNPDAVLALAARANSAQVDLTRLPPGRYEIKVNGDGHMVAGGDAVLALVAAAYADAAKRITDISAYDDVPGGLLIPNTFDEGTSAAYEMVIDATPTDATAALERMLADARAEGHKEAIDERVKRAGEILEWNLKYGKDRE